MINVNNTIVKYLVDLISPHYCCYCGEIGKIICESCKYDIIEIQHLRCFECRRPIGNSATCLDCCLPYRKMWVIGEREGALKNLINSSKYESMREGCRVQAELLHQVLPSFPPGVIVTAVPTAMKHQRARGFGHAELIAKEFARIRGLGYSLVIERIGNFVQQGADKSERIRQAKKSYQSVKSLGTDTTYLIVDDVVTTGSTLKYASEALLKAGAKEVWVAVSAYQPR